MGVIRRLLSWLLAWVVVASLALGIYALTYRDPAPIGPADAIVVLSGDYARSGQLRPQTAARVARGIELWQAGAAPLLIMSGGTYEWRYLTAAEHMAEFARNAGVPDGALRAEIRSHSTLQNALFVSEFFDTPADARIIIVSHRYHLPRAWATFRWAGFRHVQLVAADPEDWQLRPGFLLESLKIPGNLLRGALASLALRLGASQDTFIDLLG